MKNIIFGLLLWLICLNALGKNHKKSILREVETFLSNSLVAAPKDQEVCFSPENPCSAKLVKFIESAQKSIDIAIYDINLVEVIHALLVQSKKIPVRIVADLRQAKGQHSLVATLIKGGANVKFGHQRGIMHNKFVVVDGSRLETGSFNFTNHASTSNNENQIYLNNVDIVEQYKKRFEKLWIEAGPPTLLRQ